MSRQIRPTDMGAVRKRLRDLIEAPGMSARRLAHMTGDEEKNVQRWVSGQTLSIPADFIGRCEAVGFASARYLLRGEGAPTVIPDDEAAVRLEVIGKVADGSVDTAALRALTTPPDADPSEVDPEAPAVPRGADGAKRRPGAKRKTRRKA